MANGPPFSEATDAEFQELIKAVEKEDVGLFTAALTGKQVPQNVETLLKQIALDLSQAKGQVKFYVAGDRAILYHDRRRKTGITPAPAPTRDPKAEGLEAAIRELKAWLPSEDEEFQRLVGSLLAALPGGEELEDRGFKPLPVGWKETELLGNLLVALENSADVERTAKALFGEESGK